MHELKTLEGRIEALRGATMFEQAAMAQAVLDETMQVLKTINGRMILIESRLDAVQNGRVKDA